MTTIGKLHFRKMGDPTGFEDQVLPLHVRDGIGDLYWLLRGDAAVHGSSRSVVLGAQRGESEYTRYDRAIAGLAEKWLHSQAASHPEGWVLYVSFVSPHFPLIAPPEFYDLYHQDDVPLPVNWDQTLDFPNDALDDMRRLENLDEPLTERQIRGAVHAYSALVTFLDSQVGRVLRAIDESGVADSTRVIFTSDHGDMAGKHGFWSKHTMFEDSVGVPLLMAGPDIPSGRTVNTNVSHVDLFPTVLDVTGTPPAEQDADLPGISLVDVMDDRDRIRPVFSEYHAHYAANASYMVKNGSMKLIYYVGSEHQLFDLDADPSETRNIAYTSAPVQRESMVDLLRTFVDPEGADSAAKRSGEARMSLAGGRDVVAQMEPILYSPPPQVDDLVEPGRRSA